MLKNQVPHDPDYARDQGTPTLKFPMPSMTNHYDELYPQENNPPQGWGLSFFSQLHPGPRGRPAGSIYWTGVSNVIWWADFENGIGGMFAAQILPFDGLFYLLRVRYRSGG